MLLEKYLYFIRSGVVPRGSEKLYSLLSSWLGTGILGSLALGKGV